MTQDTQRTIDRCRVCNFSNLTPILSLGELFVSDFPTDSEKGEMVRAPLEVVLCDKKKGGCGLLQLKHTVSNEVMYRNYWYRSGMNKTMTDELIGIARKVEGLVRLKPGDYVMDIGVNDGTLLRGYSADGINRTGFEPARNLAQYNSVGTTKVINDFFSADAWKKEFGDAKAKAITAIAMFYDLDDPNAFVADIAECLDPEGVFIIQMSYLPLMLSQNAFDNICHEHLEYYSLLSLEYLLARHSLEVFDVDVNDINGGSYRVYVRKKQNGTSISIPAGADVRVVGMRAYEEQLGLAGEGVYSEFVNRVSRIKKATIAFMKEEVAKGKVIYGYGASTKGNTLLQFFELDATLITAIAERNQDKWGKRTVGTGIPIISEEQARAEKPDYFFVLPWHFMAEFRERERDFLARGGQFIAPLPLFRVIGR